MIKLGIISPSEIALRRFMPAITANPHFDCVGYAINSIEERYEGQAVADHEAQAMLARQKEKVQNFVTTYDGRVFESYRALVTSPDVDAVYIPLPPALHYKWARLALEHGKHVLVEKPCTLSYQDSHDLCQLALEKKLGFHENYMFAYHQQLADVQDLVASGLVGDVRLYRINFGFPKRAANDFRYDPTMGGGALIDAGGYTIRYASMILGESAKIAFAQKNYEDACEVDLYGSGILTNATGQVVQIAFGMDNDYKCELEVWGSQGTLTSDRILTAPAGFQPRAILKQNGTETEYKLSVDDSFAKSIDQFYQTIIDEASRQDSINSILKQAKLIEAFQEQATERA